MPTTTDAISLADGDTEADILQGSISKQLGPGIHRITLRAASDVNLRHTLKVDADLAIDGAVVLPNNPLSPSEDKVFSGLVEGGSNLLLSASNNTGTAGEYQFQLETERVR